MIEIKTCVVDPVANGFLVTTIYPATPTAPAAKIMYVASSIAEMLKRVEWIYLGEGGNA